MKSESMKAIPTVEKESIERDLEKVRTIYKARQKIVPLSVTEDLTQFLNMVGMIQEGLGRQGYAELAERLGIEEDTDEFKAVLEKD